MDPRSCDIKCTRDVASGKVSGGYSGCYDRCLGRYSSKYRGPTGGVRLAGDRAVAAMRDYAVPAAVVVVLCAGIYFGLYKRKRS